MTAGALSLILGCGTAERDPRCEPVGGEGAWSFVILPDTQYYAESYPEIFLSQTRWVADHAAEEGIRFVLHEGDVTNDNSAAQWSVAEEAFAELDAAGVPYSLLPGNHDYGVGGTAETRDSLLTVTMGDAWPWGAGADSGLFDPPNVDNSYQLHRVDGQTWLVLALEFGPRDAVVSWASQVLDAHAGIPAIFITHAYLYSDGTRYDHIDRPDQLWSPYDYGMAEQSTVNDGEELWSQLVAGHPDVRFVFSGHVLNEGVSRRTDVRPGGSTVHQVLANYQHRPRGGGGYLRLVQIDPEAGAAHVCTYSPFTGSWRQDDANSFDLEL